MCTSNGYAGLLACARIVDAVRRKEKGDTAPDDDPWDFGRSGINASPPAPHQSKPSPLKHHAPEKQARDRDNPMIGEDFSGDKRERIGVGASGLHCALVFEESLLESMRELEGCARRRPLPPSTLTTLRECHARIATLLAMGETGAAA